jgi:hypothetical protein
MKRLISPLLAAAIIGSLAISVGCDDSDQVPKAVIEQASKPPENSLRAPTTQELLTGHRSRTILLPIPVSLELPPGWGPDHRTGMPNLILGYTPSGGEVSIQLIPRSPLHQKDLDLLVAASRKEMAANPGKILKSELRPLGTAQVFEHQRVGEPAPLTIYDKNNKPHESIESYFEWTLDVLVPHEDGIQDNQIAFLGLTKSQYDKDKDFLNGVMSTLQYVTAGESGGTATAPAAPATDAAMTTRPAPSAPPAAPIKP